jgi:hypothetical protein
MGGGLLQLVAYGAQDAYITGNPQITFWKGLYKRHTNFAMEPFRVNFSGQAQWGTNTGDIASLPGVRKEIPVSKEQLAKNLAEKKELEQMLLTGASAGFGDADPPMFFVG